MQTDMGEYLVGAYLKLLLHCDVVDYNVRPPGGGLQGLGELDVIGLDFRNMRAYLCEVTTHLDGLLYVDNPTTIQRITAKYERQQNYAQDRLPQFTERHFMLWSPVVPIGYRTEQLEQIAGLELVINGEYTRRVDQLRQMAATETYDACNPFFRVLQILEHLRD